MTNENIDDLQRRFGYSPISEKIRTMNGDEYEFFEEFIAAIETYFTNEPIDNLAYGQWFEKYLQHAESPTTDPVLLALDEYLGGL